MYGIYVRCAARHWLKISRDSEVFAKSPTVFPLSAKLSQLVTMSSRTPSSPGSTGSLSAQRAINNRALRDRLVALVGECPKVARNARTHMCCSIVEGKNGGIGSNFGAWQLLKRGAKGGYYYTNLTEPLSREVIDGDAELQSLLRRRRELQVRSSPASSPRRGTRVSPRRQASDGITTEVLGKRQASEDPQQNDTSPRKAPRLAPDTVSPEASSEAKPPQAGPDTPRYVGQIFGRGGLMEQTRSATRARIVNRHPIPSTPTPVRSIGRDATDPSTPTGASTTVTPLFARADATAHPGPVPRVGHVSDMTPVVAPSPLATQTVKREENAPTVNPSTPALRVTSDRPPVSNSFSQTHRTLVRELTSHMEAYGALVQGTATRDQAANLRPPGWANAAVRSYLRQALKEYLASRRFIIITSIADISNGGRGHLCPFRSNGFFALSDATELLAREYGVRRQTNLVYLVSHGTETLTFYDTLHDVQQGEMLIFRFERLPPSSPMPIDSDSE